MARMRLFPFAPLRALTVEERRERASGDITTCDVGVVVGATAARAAARARRWSAVWTSVGPRWWAWEAAGGGGPLLEGREAAASASDVVAAVGASEAGAGNRAWGRATARGEFVEGPVVANATADEGAGPLDAPAKDGVAAPLALVVGRREESITQQGHERHVMCMRCACDVLDLASVASGTCSLVLRILSFSLLDTSERVP